MFSNHVIEFIVCGKTEYIIRKVKCGRQASGALLVSPTLACGAWHWLKWDTVT